jgi:ABC-type nitrate/sulfonate/bicarbonate transport system permease component
MVAVTALAAGWEIWVRAASVPATTLPAPSRIWSAFWATRTDLPHHVQATVTAAVLGLVVAAAAGAVLALGLAGVPVLRRAVYPLVVAAQSVPVLVLAPLLIAWLGLGILPKILVVALVGVFPVVVSTVDGLLRADRDEIDLVRSMGASRLTVLMRVAVPRAVPGYLAGAKVAAAYATFAAVVGEWMGAEEGLGLYLTRSLRAYRTDQAFVGVLLIAAASVALFAAVTAIGRLAAPWTSITTEER